YELLEKSDDELYYKFKGDSEAHTRSCSLDSGNYIPTDDESIPDQQHSAGGHHSHHVSRLSRYCSSLEAKSKSAPDIDDLDDMFLMEDPRDLPREKLCVKSDGNFYKKIKMAMGGSSRMSSPESRSDYYESKLSKSSGSSKKSKDSVYHTDSNKKSRETLKSKSGSGFNSRASSQDSKDCFGGMDILLTKNYEMPTTTSKKAKYLSKRFDSSSRNSSQDSKSDYYDASEQQHEHELDADGADMSDEIYSRAKVSHSDEHIRVGEDDALSSIAKNGISATAASFYDNQIYSSTFPSAQTKPTSVGNDVGGGGNKTSHVHSISLQ
uniref:Uncharacterized protein n=1 Tax=Anopheles maculatus TaxID=74869 RepID=A0A182SRV2_9DIPT